MMIEKDAKGDRIHPASRPPDPATVRHTVTLPHPRPPHPHHCLSMSIGADHLTQTPVSTSATQGASSGPTSASTDVTASPGVLAGAVEVVADVPEEATGNEQDNEQDDPVSPTPLKS